MNRSRKTVIRYLAAFLAAAVLHTGLAVGLGGFLSAGADRVPVTEKLSHQDALVVSFYQPKPAELHSEETESITRLHTPLPKPIPEPSQVDPDVEVPEKNPSPTNEQVKPLKPPVPEQGVETVFQPPFAGEQPPGKTRASTPVKIERPRPLQPIDAEAVYPLGARLRGEEGAVRIVVRIGADGRIGELEMRESSGYIALDQAAERALRRTRFAPATLNDQPVPGELTITIRFSLDS